MTSLEQIARILRADKTYLEEVDRELVRVTGKKDVLDQIAEENRTLMGEAMLTLGVSKDAKSHEIYTALISKVSRDDQHIFQALGKPDSRVAAECQKVASLAKDAINPPRGLFLKLDKAKEFLTKEPPREVMRFLGYGNVAEMLEKEDLFEVYSSLRFIEGNEWLNNTFFKQYEHLTPADFEEREVVVRALGQKWGEEASKFVAKKHHNISHLKELGVVFIIPTTLGISGEILRMIALIAHYLYEVPFYSDMFRLLAKQPDTFAPNIISLLRGDVPTARHLSEDPSTWLVIQRYLAKDDENDWRLAAAHINPEALHWAKAIAAIPKMAELMGGSKTEMSFWSNSGWIGNYFQDENGIDVLVSFDLVDTVMALVQQKEMIKYLYHHQETLWNRVFTAYFGEEEIEKRAREFLLQGYFQI